MLAPLLLQRVTGDPVRIVPATGTLDDPFCQQDLLRSSGIPRLFRRSRFNNLATITINLHGDSPYDLSSIDWRARCYCKWKEKRTVREKWIFLESLSRMLQGHTPRLIGFTWRMLIGKCNQWEVLNGVLENSWRIERIWEDTFTKLKPKSSNPTSLGRKSRIVAQSGRCTKVIWERTILELYLDDMKILRIQQSFLKEESKILLQNC